VSAVKAVRVNCFQSLWSSEAFNYQKHYGDQMKMALMQRVVVSLICTRVAIFNGSIGIN